MNLDLIKEILKHSAKKAAERYQEHCRSFGKEDGAQFDDLHTCHLCGHGGQVNTLGRCEFCTDLLKQLEISVNEELICHV